ncbi:hypothetical protein FKP32DRAFT_1571457 [Trametes sanguinea]|nr:hypothetical protein FKP32DRAFT_1571457 [Trametes sanguinea]
MDCRETPSTTSVECLLRKLHSSLATYLIHIVTATPKLTVWRSALLPVLNGAHTTLPDLLHLRPYVRCLSVTQAHAVLRLLAGVPPLGIEVLRYRGVDRKWRVCRFCRRQSCVEDEEHVLFHCMEPSIATLRRDTMAKLVERRPTRAHLQRRLGLGWRYIGTMLLDQDACGVVADWIIRIFERCGEVEPLLITTESMFLALSE